MTAQVHEVDSDDDLPPPPDLPLELDNLHSECGYGFPGGGYKGDGPAARLGLFVINGTRCLDTV